MHKTFSSGGGSLLRNQQLSGSLIITGHRTAVNRSATCPLLAGCLHRAASAPIAT